MQLKNVEACHYTLYSFCYLSFHFPFSTTQAQLLPKQIFVGKFTPSSIAFTDLDFWTGQFSAKGAQGPQIASFLSCQCLNEGLRKELLYRRSSMFSNIFPEKRFSCIIHIVNRHWKKRWAAILQAWKNVEKVCVLLWIARIVYASICNASIHVASMSILYSDLAMHLLLSVKHGMVPHLVHGACTAPVIVWGTELRKLHNVPK